MCIKPAFPGEFETLFVSLLFLLKGEKGECPWPGRIGTELSPGLSRPPQSQRDDFKLGLFFSFLLLGR